MGYATAFTIALVFGAMLVISGKKIDELTAERDEARDIIVNTFPELQDRMNELRDQLKENELRLHEDRRRMLGDGYEEAMDDLTTGDSLPVTNE